MRRAYALSVISVLVASLSLGGCGHHRDSSTMSSADSSFADGSASPADRRPVNLGPAIGHDDSLINVIAPQLAAWVGIWGQAMPGFALDSLHRGGAARAFGDAQVQPLPVAEGALAGNAHRVFFVDSPDRRYTLVIDQYQGLDEEKGVLVVSGGVDSAPLLLDRGLKTASRFAACGASCRFEWGAWIDSTRFALAGSGSWSGGAGGYLDVYSLVDSSRTRYWTRVISDVERRNYGAAWGQWLRDRYHELKESRASR